MAAVVPFAAPLVERGRRAVVDIVDDPVAWVIKVCRLVGSAFLVAGFAFGTAGYYLKASATTAMNNEKQIVSNMGSIFSNIKPLTYTPAATGTAPVGASLAGVQNFFSDAWTDVKALGSDLAGVGGLLGTLGEDVANGIVDVAKVLLAFVMHFPDLLWNGLVWGVGGSIADIVNWLFPYLILIGAILVVVSFALWGARAFWTSVLRPGFEEAWAEKKAELTPRVGTFWRKLLRVRSSAPPNPQAGPAAETDLVEPPEVGGAAPFEAGSQLPEDRPTGEAPRRRELEHLLGEGYTEAKDRFRAAQRAQSLSPAASSA